MGGFSLIEVLVAVLIMAVGILGMAGLQVVSMQQNRSSLLRAEAMQIGNDMLDRIRSNPTADYTGVAFDDDPAVVGTCINTECSLDQMRDFDIAQWKCSINSVDENGDTYTACDDSHLNITGSLPQGAGKIEVSGNIHEVSVRWLDGSNGQTATVTLRTRTASE